MNEKLKFACQGKTKRNGGLNTPQLKKIVKKRDLFVEEYTRSEMETVLCGYFLPAKQKFKLTFKLQPIVYNVDYIKLNIKDTKRLILQNINKINNVIHRSLWGLIPDGDDVNRLITEELIYNNRIFTLKIDNIKYMQKTNAFLVKLIIYNLYYVKKSELKNLVKYTLKMNYDPKNDACWPARELINDYLIDLKII